MIEIPEADPWAVSAAVLGQLRARQKLEREAPCPACRGAGQYGLLEFVMLNAPPMLFQGVCKLCLGGGFFKRRSA